MNVGDVALRRRMDWIQSNLFRSWWDNVKVLDVGCGDGLYSMLFPPGSYLGVDPDPEMIQRARDLHPRQLFSVGGALDCRNLWDRIICSEVLEHVPDPLSALQNLRRCLIPEGIALVTVPNRFYPFWFDPTRQWGNHGHLFYPAEIKEICESAGFVVEKCELLTTHVFPFYYNIIHAGAVIHHKIPIPGTNRYGHPPGWINPIRWAQWMIDFVDARNDYNPQWQTNIPSVNIALKLRIRRHV